VVETLHFVVEIKQKGADLGRVKDRQPAGAEENNEQAELFEETYPRAWPVVHEAAQGIPPASDKPREYKDYAADQPGDAALEEDAGDEDDESDQGEEIHPVAEGEVPEELWDRELDEAA